MAVKLCNWVWRVLIAAVLLIAAYAKYKEGIRFPAATIYDRMINYSPWRHYAVIALEMLIGLWMLSSVRTRWSSITAAVLFAGFSAIIGVEIFRATPALCGCGIQQVFPGGDPRVELGFSLARNVVLLIGCGWLWLMSEEQPETKTSPEQHQQTSA